MFKFLMATVVKVAAAGAAVLGPPMVTFQKDAGAQCAIQHGCLTIDDLLKALQCCATFCSGELEEGCVAAVFGDGSNPAKNLAVVQMVRVSCQKIRDTGMPDKEAQPVADSIALIAVLYPDALTRERVRKVGSQVPIVDAAVQAAHNEQGGLAPG